MNEEEYDKMCLELICNKICLEISDYADKKGLISAELAKTIIRSHLSKTDLEGEQGLALGELVRNSVRRGDAGELSKDVKHAPSQPSVTHDGDTCSPDARQPPSTEDLHRVGGAGELSKDVKHAPRKGKEAER